MFSSKSKNGKKPKAGSPALAFKAKSTVLLERTKPDTVTKAPKTNQLKNISQQLSKNGRNSKLPSIAPSDEPAKNDFSRGTQAHAGNTTGASHTSRLSQAGVAGGTAKRAGVRVSSTVVNTLEIKGKIGRASCRERV